MKLPPNAKRVFKGQIFDVYQWPQLMYDGSSEMFEALKRPDTVLVIPIYNNKIIISEQQQPHRKEPYFSLLGGRNDQNEDSLACAKRELMEESGLSSTKWELYKTYEPFSKFDWTIFIYFAKDCQKIGDQNLDAGEKVKLEEVDFDKFVDVVTSDNFWGGEFATDLLRLEKAGKLNVLKKMLFD